MDSSNKRPRLVESSIDEDISSDGSEGADSRGVPEFIRALYQQSAPIELEEQPGCKYDSTDERALILYEHENLDQRWNVYLNPNGFVPVVLDPDLAHYLRTEQKEGLQFLFDNFSDKRGCILAHLMGAGKTLTCISFIHVLLEQSRTSRGNSIPAIRNAVMVVPKTMVGVWEGEFKKWLKDIAYCKYIPQVVSMKFRKAAEDEEIIDKFLSPDSRDKVLILSYERLVKFHSKFTMIDEPLDLIIFDEAHVLKNDDSNRSKIAEAANFKVKVLATGTPVQNTLEELFRLVDIAQPNALQSGTMTSSPEEFQANYISPFTSATLTRNQYKLSEENLQKLSQLKEIISPILHIRQNPVNVPKHEMIICLKPEEVQKKMYELVSDCCKERSTEEKYVQLKNHWYSNITLLRTICSHPKLALKQIQKSSGYVKCHYVRMRNLYNDFRKMDEKYEGILSTKMKFIFALVHELQVKYDSERRQDKAKKIHDKERVVIVSNYTEVLDMIEKLLSTSSYNCLKLYGKTSQNKRLSNITTFNEKKDDNPVFLLSLKAGGAGITLIGANHLVLVDPDWNPANDEQAIARIWRHGQTRPCYIYRLLNTGTVEEVIFKRQQTKKELDRYVVDEDFDSFNTLPEAKKEIINLKQNTLSSIHDAINCRRESCVGITTSPNTVNGSDAIQNSLEPVASSSFADYALNDRINGNVQNNVEDDHEHPDEENEKCDISYLANPEWTHCHSNDQLPRGIDEVPFLRKMWGFKDTLDLQISFVFYKKTNPIPIEEQIENGSDLLDYLVRSPNPNHSENGRTD